MKLEDMFPKPQTEIGPPLRVVVFVEGEDAVVLMTSDLDYGLGTMLDETEMPHPPSDGIWAWVDNGSRPAPAGLDSMYPECVDWRGTWVRLPLNAIEHIAGGVA